MTSHKALAARFAALIEKSGGAVQSSYAQTGTIYVTASGDEGEIKVRFADHGECYCREDLSVDPDGCTYEQAVRATMRRTGLDLSRSLRSIAAASKRRANEAAASRAAYAPIYEAAAALDAARLAFQADYVARKIAARIADAGEISKKTMKRYRGEANAAFAARG